MSTLRRAAYNALVLYLGKAIGIGLSTITLAMTMRYLGVERFGDFSAVVSFAAIVVSVTDLGLTWIVSRELAQEREDGLNTLASFKLLFSALSVVAALVLVPFIGFAPFVRQGIYIAGLYMFFVAANNLQIALLQGKSQLDKTAYGDVIARVANLVLVWWIVRHDYGYAAIVATLVTTSVAVLACNQYFIRKLELPPFRFTLQGIRKYRKEILQMAAYATLGFLVYKVDMVILARMRPSFDVGIYAAAYRILDVAMAVPSIMIGALYPVLSHAAVSDDAAYRFRVRRHTLTAVSVFALVTAAAAYIFAPLAIRIVAGGSFAVAGSVMWSGQLVTASTVFRILSVFLFFAYFGSYLNALLIAQKRQGVNIAANALGLAVNVTGNILLIPAYSYLACAVLTVVTQAVVMVPLLWGVWRMRRETR